MKKYQFLLLSSIIPPLPLSSLFLLPGPPRQEPIQILGSLAELPFPSPPLPSWHEI